MFPNHTKHIVHFCMLFLLKLNFWTVESQPVAMCPSNKTVNIELGDEGTVIIWEEPTILGSSEDVTLVSQSHSNGTIFPPGVTEVMYTFTDALQGNRFSCSFFVEVIPTTNRCSPNPCQNDGICLQNGNTLCDCIGTGFTGNTCSQTNNPCNPNPCNGGTCNVRNNAALCNCAPTVNVGQFCTFPIEIMFQDITLITINEGHSHSRDVCLDPPLPRTFPVLFSVGPSVTDLTFPTSSSIPVGQTCTSIQFTAINDGFQEGPEAFQIFLTSQAVHVDPNQDQIIVSVPANGVCTPNPCNGGICSDQGGQSVCDCSGTTFVGGQCDVPKAEIRFSTSSTTVLESISTTSVDVCLTNVQSLSSNVVFTLVNSPTLSSANDYGVPATGTISAGNMCTIVTISITNDLIVEQTEQFVVTLASITEGNAKIDTNFDTFTVTILDNDVDNEDPTVVCIDDVIRNIPLGTGTVTVSWTEPTAIDNSGSVSLQQRSHAPGSTFQTGTTVVTYIFADPAGNTASCIFRVIVNGDINECDTTSCDNTTTNCVNADGGFTCECQTGLVKDPVNPRTCISSKEGPVVTMCPTSTNYVTCGSEYEVTWITPEVRGASDMNIVMNSSHSPGDLFKLGDTEVIYTFEDQFGNVALCSFQISVRKQTENCRISSYIPYVVGIACLLFGLLLAGILMVLRRKVCTNANKNKSQNLQNRDIHTSVVGGSVQTKLPRPTESTELETLHHMYDEPVRTYPRQSIMSNTKPSDVEGQYEQIKETRIGSLCDLGKSDAVGADMVCELLAVPLNMSGDRLKFYTNDDEDILVTSIT